MTKEEKLKSIQEKRDYKRESLFLLAKRDNKIRKLIKKNHKLNGKIIKLEDEILNLKKDFIGM